MLTIKSLFYTFHGDCPCFMVDGRQQDRELGWAISGYGVSFPQIMFEGVEEHFHDLIQ